MRFGNIVKRCTAWLLVVGLGIYGYSSLPDHFSFYQDQLTATDHWAYTLDFDQDEVLETAQNRSSAIQQGQYTAKLKILGFLPTKDVTVTVIKKQKLVPCGFPFGIKLYTEGVLVVGTGDFMSSGRYCNPAYEAGIRIGDRLVSYGGVEITSNEQLAKLVAQQQGAQQTAVIIRKNLKFEAVIKPQKDDTAEQYHIGLWIRDSSAGIGTMTFYNPDTHQFGGLGHSITDVDTGQLLNASGGSFVTANIKDAIKGVPGEPGELRGSFCDETLGQLTANTEVGLFGQGDISNVAQNEPMEIALKSEIHTGKAYILTCIGGKQPARYEIEIEKINNNLQQNKNMCIRVTDPVLLDETGGIVQGMSGSPIIQDGKLIGAVTHVYVNDSTRGYGIFIENMLMEICEK